MCTSLNQLMRIALLLTAIDAALVLFPVTAHAGSGFRRAIDAGVAGAKKVAVLVNIDKTNQQMTVSLDGVELGKPDSHGCVRISPKNAATLYELVKENGLENTQVVLTGAPNLVDLLGYDQRHVARQSVPEPLAPISSGSSKQPRFHAIVESMEAEFEASWQSLSTVERQLALTALAQTKQFEVLLSAHVVKAENALDHKHNSLVAATAQAVLANSLKVDENSFRRSERKSHYEEIKAAMEGIRQSKRRSVHRTAPQARIAPSCHAAAQCRRRRLYIDRNLQAK
jgi:hypothetical protein